MIGLICVGFLVLSLVSELPNAQSIRGIELKVPLRVYSADKLLISEFGDERRKPIEIDQAPQVLIDSVLAAEDDGFFEHKGIDLKGLFRAALSNFQSGKTQQGASTITMQVARNFYLTPEKTYLRKIKEVLLAIRLEQALSKKEILALYLNKIFLGHRAYGFGAASEVYYGKPLQELSLAEIAMLAGLPKAPSSYNPLRNPSRATKRRNYVLGRLKELELINEADYETASNASVTAKKHGKPSGLDAPYIAEMVRAQLTDEFGKQAYWQGLNVYTTIESKQQIAAQKALRKGLQRYDRRHGFRGAIAKVDLKRLQKEVIEQSDEDRTLEDAYLDTLAIYPSSQEQTPALAITVEQNRARVQTQDNGIVELSLKTSQWAKKHLTANRVGEAPSAMTDLLAPGDIVYIQPTTQSKSKPSDAADTTEWRLSQIPNIGGALISIDPRNGRVLSLVGGYDFFLNKYNRATQSIRQPGSNIKPFIYSASLDQGFTPATLISGAPIVMRDPAHGTVWRPENYSGKFFGPTRMREALSKSMNLVSIRLLRSIGIPTARDYIERFGINMNRFSPTLTMALGAGGATPMEVLSAYGTLANGGYKVQPSFIDTITDRKGNVVYRAKEPEYCDTCYADYLPKPESVEENGDDIDDEEFANQNGETQTDELESENVDQADQDPSIKQFYPAQRVMSHANNFMTVSMLRDVVKRGTARKALALKREDLAGKTGTTNDYVDAWFTGFNSKVATTVWVGFDQPSSMGRGEAGSKAALPIWVDYMRTALDGVEEDELAIPDYIEEGFVNRTTGRRTDELDPNATPEYFVVEDLVPERALIDANQQNIMSAEAAALQQKQEMLELEPDTDNELVDPPVPTIEQGQRILENEEETEGLF